MRIYYTLFLMFFVANLAFGQAATQRVRGVVLDKFTKQPLIGASVGVKATSLGAITDVDGQFTIENVPIGRIGIQCQYIGYEIYAVEDIILTSVKEAYLEIELSEVPTAMNEVVVSSQKNAFEAVNPLSVVSTRSFTADETDRIAAGINDPGRVALSFPGVKQGPDETENAIIVRGNSPVGILWRVEGIDIPNPNHFALIGSSVGGISVFSAQLLARSDFSSGGMPAEYGNAISGAFDMHFRRGNNEKRENRVKIGIIGLDFSTEGPIKNGTSSYLVNYRYSTLGLLNKAGFNLVGERVSNDFQDLSFNIVVGNKNPKIRQTIFGMGGLSLEVYSPVENPIERDSAEFNNRNKQYKPAKMGAVGTTWTYLANTTSYWKAVVAIVGSDIRRQNDTFNIENAAFRYHEERYIDRRIAASLAYNVKLGGKTTVKSGLIFNQIFFDFFKETTPVRSQSDINDIQKQLSVEGKGSTQTIQHYTQASIKLTQRFTANVGYHVTFLAANKTSSFEPRVALQFLPAPNHQVSLAYGLHGQILPLMTYYFKDTLGNYANKDLPMLKTHHAVLAYHIYTKSKMKISFETYAQKLFNVPIAADPDNNYWMLNNTNGYPSFVARSDGKGWNYGLDIGVEKLFTKGYYVLVTGSVFESNFQTHDAKIYNSRWGSKFSSSCTFGKEFYFRKGRVIQIGGRFLYSGGGTYTPYDPELSAAEGTYIALKGADFNAQLPNYWRLDTRLAYRYNTRKLAGGISLDIQNTTNRINATGVSYEATTNTTKTQYRGGGLIPVLSFQFDF